MNRLLAWVERTWPRCPYCNLHRGAMRNGQPVHRFGEFGWCPRRPTEPVTTTTHDEAVFLLACYAGDPTNWPTDVRTVINDHRTARPELWAAWAPVEALR